MVKSFKIREIIQKISKFSTFPRFLGIITAITVLFTFIVLFKIQPVFDYLLTNDTNFLNLNKNLFSKIPIIELLIAIVGALSAILAIVFSLTIISIESVSEKYTPYIIEKYRKNKQTRYTLYAFILVIVASLFLLLIKELLIAYIVLFYLVLIVFGFVTCFILLINYFYFIFDIINPIKLASILAEEVVSNIKDGRKEEVVPIITAMGDISIRSLQRHEEDTASHYISELYDIFLRTVSEIQNLDYLHKILDSYQRILGYCIASKNKLRFKILDIYAEIPMIIYYAEKLNKFNNEVFSEHQTYLNNLYFANKQIINNNDFELFKSEIHSISMRIVDDPKKINEEIKNELFLNDFVQSQLHQDTEIQTKRKHLHILLEKHLAKNFSIFEHYKIVLDSFDEFFSLATKHLTTKEEQEKIKSKSDEIRDKLFKLYLDSTLHRTFLLVGGYCLFVQNEKKVESDKYLRELWLHTNPADARAIIGNEVPISSDIEFLCNMLFWGGENSFFWYDHYSFEGFHGAKNYIYKYFLLLLTHLREKQNKELTISISKETEKEELEFRYIFSKRFISESIELIEYCDELIQESTNWNFLFPPKKQEDKAGIQTSDESKFIEITTKDQFENTKKWLENKKIELENKIKEIESYLPFDSLKVVNCKNKILESFNMSSEISKAVSIKEFDATRDSALDFIFIYYHPIIPKDCLLAASNVDCSALWFGFGRNIAFGEINYFVKQVLEAQDIEKTVVKDSENNMGIYDKIDSTIKSLKGKGYNPTTIFLPLNYLSKLRKEGWNRESKLYGKFTYSDRQTFKFDESTKLEIIHSSNYTKFDDIIILDKNACIWTFKPTEKKERLHVEIKDYKEEPTKIDLIAKTEINLSIENRDAIKVLITNKQSLQS